MPEEINEKPVENLTKDLDQNRKKKKRKKMIILISSALLILIIILSLSFRNKDNNKYSFNTVEKNNLIQTVSETGTLKSVNEIELNFLNTGKINEILVSIGDKVSAKQILAKLDYSDLSIESRQKQAQLEIAQANLNKLINGATDYEIAVYEANVNQAKTNYESTIKELEKLRASVEEETSQAEVNMETEISNEKMSSIIIMESNLTKSETALDEINTILEDNDAEHVLSVRNKTYLQQTQSNYNSYLVYGETKSLQH